MRSMGLELASRHLRQKVWDAEKVLPKVCSVPRKHSATEVKIIEQQERSMHNPL